MIRVGDVLARVRPVLGAVGEGVLLPVGTYVLLGALGASDVLALTGSAAAAVVLLTVGWLRTRTLNTLGILVLVRFALSLLLLGLTDDARLLLVKDAAITGLIGLAVLASLALRSPFILRVQRDLSADKTAFDHRIDRSPPLRRLYRRVTLLWGACLTLETLVETVIIYRSSLTTAVVACNVIGTVVILTLVAVTQLSARRHHLAT